MRKFYLVNELNTRYDLQNINTNGFLASPSGLGYSVNITYTRIGNAFLEESREPEQGTIDGSVYFKGYAEYQDFINFIESSEKLRLIYKPLEIEYFRDVDFTSITKTEIDPSTGCLICPIQVKCKGLYYTEDNKQFIMEHIEGESRYDLPFPFTFNDYSSIGVTYTNTGHIESDLLAEVHGYIENPILDLYVNKIRKYRVVFNITVQSGQKLLYSAKDGNNYVMLEDVDGSQTNVIDCLDLANNNFFKMPKGISSINLSSATGVLNKVVFRIMTRYKGV